MSSRLHIRVLRISGLTSSDKAVPTSLMQDDTTQEADESGGVAIEINSPEEVQRSLRSLMHRVARVQRTASYSSPSLHCASGDQPPAGVNMTGCHEVTTAVGALQTEDEDGAPKQMGKKMFERVLEQLPASSAGKVRISAAIEELNLERQLPLHDVDARGNVHVNQSVDLQLSAIQAALDIKVRMLEACCDAPARSSAQAGLHAWYRRCRRCR